MTFGHRAVKYKDSKIKGKILCGVSNRTLINFRVVHLRRNKMDFTHVSPFRVMENAGSKIKHHKICKTTATRVLDL